MGICRCWGLWQCLGREGRSVAIPAAGMLLADPLHAHPLPRVRGVSGPLHSIPRGSGWQQPGEHRAVLASPLLWKLAADFTLATRKREGGGFGVGSTHSSIHF